jgi:hypothetical protein
MRPDPDAAPDSEKLVQPLGAAVKFILILAAVLLGIVLVFAVFGTIQPGGLGSGPACLAVHLNDITVTGTHLRPGATASAGTVSLCVSHPTIGQRVLSGLTWIPAVALYLAVIGLLAQMVRTARTGGPFAQVIATRLRFLGWFVLAGSLIAVTGQSAAQSAFVSTLLTSSVPAVRNAVEAGLAVIFVPLLIACGLLTLARVIRAGAEMNDDLAGTV